MRGLGHLDLRHERVEKQRDQSAGDNARAEHLRDCGGQDVENFGRGADAHARPQGDGKDEPFARRHLAIIEDPDAPGRDESEKHDGKTAQHRRRHDRQIAPEEGNEAE